MPKKASRKKLTETESVQKNSHSMVNQDPEFVLARLKQHKDHLSQDIGELRIYWPTLQQKLWPNNKTVSALDYLRSRLLIPKFLDSGPNASTPVAWHPHILDYCRTLGVIAEPVDQLYQRIVSGDLTDQRGVEAEADRCFESLDKAIEHARQQWLNGESLIRMGTQKWSSHRSPKEWEWIFEILGDGVTWRTLLRRIDRGALIRNPIGTSRRVSFAMHKLPEGYNDRLTKPKLNYKGKLK